MVHNMVNDKPRGYAFIEYEHERDMHCKYHVWFLFLDIFYTFVSSMSLGLKFEIYTFMRVVIFNIVAIWFKTVFQFAHPM